MSAKRRVNCQPREGEDRRCKPEFPKAPCDAPRALVVGRGSECGTDHVMLLSPGLPNRSSPFPRAFLVEGEVIYFEQMQNGQPPRSGLSPQNGEVRVLAQDHAQGFGSP